MDKMVVLAGALVIALTVVDKMLVLAGALLIVGHLAFCFFDLAGVDLRDEGS